MNKYLLKIETVLIKPFNRQINASIFRRCVYGLLFLKLILLWPSFPMFYQNAASNFKGVSLNSIIYQTIFLFSFSKFIYWLFALVVLLATILNKKVWLSILVFIIGCNFIALVTPAQNGGDLYLNFFLLCIIFISEEKTSSEMENMVSNAAFFLLQMHMCFVYFINGYCKLIELNWLNGHAMHNILQLNSFANTYLIPRWLLGDWSCTLLGWATIIFELLFPVLIWLDRFKKSIIAAGVLFHLAIAVFLSLPDFGITMIISYVLFIKWVKKEKSNPIQGYSI